MSIFGSGEEFDETQLPACCCDLGWGSVDYLGRSFSEFKVDYNPINGIVSHDEGELHANYAKMSQLACRFREKMAMNLSRFTHKFCGKKLLPR